MRLMKFLDRAWRLFATALSFSVFGIGGLILSVLVLPLLFVITRDSERRKVRARKLVGKSFGAFWMMMYVLRIFDFEIKGRERIAEADNMLIVANHPTLIDVVMLISLFPLANCVIKKAVTQNIFMRGVVGAANYISNSAPEELVDSCVTSLEGGGSLLLFPEGTRTTQDHAMEFKPGAATVAIRAGVTVLPIAISCEPLFLSKEQPWHHVPLTRPQFRFHILDPVTPPDAGDDSSGDRHARHTLNSMVSKRISRALDSMEIPQNGGYNT